MSPSLAAALTTINVAACADRSSQSGARGAFSTTLLRPCEGNAWKLKLLPGHITLQFTSFLAYHVLPGCGLVEAVLLVLCILIEDSILAEDNCTQTPSQVNVDDTPHTHAFE